MRKLEIYKILNTGDIGCITIGMLANLDMTKEEYESYLNLPYFGKVAIEKSMFTLLAGKIIEDTKIRINKTVSELDNVRKTFFQSNIINWDDVVLSLIDTLPENAIRITNQQIYKYLDIISKPITDLHKKKHLITQETDIKH